MNRRLAVLVSGGGTTLANLIESIARGELDATISLVVASAEGLPAVDRARRAGLPVLVAPAREQGQASQSKRLFDECRRADVALVVMAGFLTLLTIPEDFFGRVFNIHPSLIPAFCGKGYHGARVHSAALERGVKISGCTVHFADNEYDHGPIVAQQAVDVLEDDTPDTLAKRVFAAECELYPRAIGWFLDGRIQVEGRRVLVKPASTPTSSPTQGRTGLQERPRA